MNNQLTLPPGTPKPTPFVPLLIGLAIILVGAGLWQLERTLRPDEGVEENTEEEVTAAPMDDILQVGAQSAGSVVSVSRVNVPPPGVWVVVGEIREGMVWRALGAARVRDTTNDVRIDLLRPTVPGEEYAVLLYRDDGDEVFELRGDSAYIDYESAESVTASFVAR